MATLVLVSNGDCTALMVDGHGVQLSAKKIDLHIDPLTKFSIDAGETDLYHTQIESGEMFFERASKILGDKIGYK